jgi:hypothetical protein
VDQTEDTQETTETTGSIERVIDARFQAIEQMPFADNAELGAALHAFRADLIAYLIRHFNRSRVDVAAIDARLHAFYAENAPIVALLRVKTPPSVASSFASVDEYRKYTTPPPPPVAPTTSATTLPQQMVLSPQQQQLAPPHWATMHRGGASSSSPPRC